MNPSEEFEREVAENIEALSHNAELRHATRNWIGLSLDPHYSYNFSSLGRPIIQYPQDMVALQEIIWRVRPDLIVETGIAHGGSLILSASMLSLLDYCDAITSGSLLDPHATNRRVLGIDIDIRAHNRAAIEAHPLSHRIDMIEGSSIAPDIIARAQGIAKPFKKVLVVLDSNHTHDHVLAELEAYAPLTSAGSYCVVFDTVIEDLDVPTGINRPWGKGNNPKTAVWEYLRVLESEGRTAADGRELVLSVDKSLEAKLQITVAPDGYLKRPEAS